MPFIYAEFIAMSDFTYPINLTSGHIGYTFWSDITISWIIPLSRKFRMYTCKIVISNKHLLVTAYGATTPQGVGDTWSPWMPLIASPPYNPSGVGCYRSRINALVLFIIPTLLYDIRMQCLKIVKSRHYIFSWTIWTACSAHPCCYGSLPSMMFAA